MKKSSFVAMILGTVDVYKRQVLGFNQKGKELLSLIKQTASLPIITQYNQLRKLSPYAKTLFELETTATDLYGLSTPQVQPCGKEFTQGIVTALCNER